MTWLTNLIKSFFNLFKSGSVLPQLIITDACNRVFKSKPALALKVLQVASTAISMMQSGQIVTVAMLNDFVTKQMAGANLTPEEVSIVQVLIGSVASQLTTPSPVGNLDQAITLLTWIRDAASLASAIK